MSCHKPCCFIHHVSFMEELSDFITKHGSSTSTVDESLGSIQKLFEKHFFERSPMFTPKHLGIAQGFGGYTVYWIHLVILGSNLSRTQLPKAYFYKTDDHISFLCLDSHIQNYKDSKLRSVATTRLKDMIEIVRNHNS